MCSGGYIYTALSVRGQSRTGGDRELETRPIAALIEVAPSNPVCYIIPVSTTTYIPLESACSPPWGCSRGPETPFFSSWRLLDRNTSHTYSHTVSLSHTFTYPHHTQYTPSEIRIHKHTHTCVPPHCIHTRLRKKKPHPFFCLSVFTPVVKKEKVLVNSSETTVPNLSSCQPVSSTMVYNVLKYRRPAFVRNIGDSDSCDSRSISLQSSSNGSHGIAGIPSSLSFERVVDGGTCPVRLDPDRCPTEECEC